jgi:XTP/dITP diphosphohydrolase
LKLLLATTSSGKIREQRVALQGLDVEITSLAACPDIVAPDEPGPTFLDNAVAKAMYYHDATGVASVGEDSGLVVDALDGQPGIHSARWLGHDTPYDVKNARLLEQLTNVSEQGRAARFVSAVALAYGNEIVFSVRETCEGLIATDPRGKDGFGYDPIFFFPPLNKTMAELTAEEKNRISHRGKAVTALRVFLESWSERD